MWVGVWVWVVMRYWGREGRLKGEAEGGVCGGGGVEGVGGVVWNACSAQEMPYSTGREDEWKSEPAGKVGGEQWAGGG